MCMVQLLLRKQLLYRNGRSRKNSRAKKNIFSDSNSSDHDEGDGKTGIFKFLSVNEQHEKFGNINTVNATF